MYHSTLDDVEGRNFKVIDVVFSFCRVYSDDSEGHDQDSLISELDKQALSLGADGIIGISYKCVTSWAKEFFERSAKYYDEDLQAWVQDSRLHYVEVQDMFAYGTAIKFEE